MVDRLGHHSQRHGRDTDHRHYHVVAANDRFGPTPGRRPRESGLPRREGRQRIGHAHRLCAVVPGNAAGFGGFFFRAQFGQNVNLNGAQAICGLCASTAVLATRAGAVAALVNMIGVGYNDGCQQRNWFLFPTTAAARRPGSIWSNQCRANTTHGYDLIIYCPPGAATEIFVRVINIHSGATVLDTSYTTDFRR